jgi:hypothetical protein
VRDVADAGMQSPEYLMDCINGEFQDPQNGGAVYARGGYDRATSSALDGGSSDYVAALHTIVTSDGTQRTFAFVGTKVYRESGDTSWTDVTPVGVTIASTGVKYVISYNDELIVSDDTNEPWRGTNLGSTPITGTEIEVNTAGSAWAARGKPTVYGGKLFFIAALIGSTNYNSRLVWSEELSASTGYLQDGYTNSWDLVQTGSDRISQILGTNAALYYWRGSSIGAIEGAVNATFQTTSTHDAVSQEIGTLANCAPLLAQGSVWFLDRRGLPMRFAVGGSSIDPLWEQLRGRVDRVRKVQASLAITSPHIAYDQQRRKVLMASVRDVGTDTYSSLAAKSPLVFDGATGNYEGRTCIELASQPGSASSETTLAAVAVTCIAGCLDRTTGEPCIYIGGIRDDETQGHIWHQVLLAGAVGDNAAAMHFSIVTHLVPDEQNVEAIVDEVTIETTPDTTAVSLDYYTPRSSSTGITMGATAADDVYVAGVGGVNAFNHGIARAMPDTTKAYGRWFRVVFHKNVAAGATTHAFERASFRFRLTKAGPLSP